MRSFSYYLFENFDATSEADNPENPRRLLGKQTDSLLDIVAHQPASYRLCAGTCGEEVVSHLIRGGILRREEDHIFFDTPVFLREDAALLRAFSSKHACFLVNMLEHRFPEIRLLCQQLHNGFSVEENLYHILCGMIFDGTFFDYLCTTGSLATSRMHASGLDYLSVIYEKSDVLDICAKDPLCSYNRLANSLCSLQSFGDAHGDRFDFYRFFRLLEQGPLPPCFHQAQTLMCKGFGKPDRDAFLTEVLHFLRREACISQVPELMELFGYATNGKVCVPVYLPDIDPLLQSIETIVEECIGLAVSRILLEAQKNLPLTSVIHGVSARETANELYHILFGGINEELVTRGLVAAPSRHPDGGRYLKCIQLYA